MRNAHRERLGKSERAAPLLRTAMQGHGRLAVRRPFDLDLAPADPADPKAEDLRHRLFRRPASREMQHVTPAIHALPFRVHAVQEARVVLLEHAADAVRLDDVDAHLGRPARRHSTVTLFARLRGWSTSFPRRSAM